MRVFTSSFIFSPSLQNQARRRTQAGLSLIEIIVVLLIIAGILGLVGPQIFGQFEKSKVKTTQSQIEMLSTALDAYRLENGHYPTTSEGLEVLVENTANSPTWNGPYLRKRQLPLDGWNQPFQYERPAQRGGIDYDLYSFGADGKEGGEELDQDIGNW